MNQASRWYPRLILWIALGLIALALRRPTRSATPGRDRTRGVRRDHAQRPGSLRRPALRPSRGSRVHPLRLMRAARHDDDGCAGFRCSPAPRTSRRSSRSARSSSRTIIWDTDVSGPLTLAERLRGSGPVYVPHYGEWTTFWWLLATRALPWHATALEGVRLRLDAPRRSTARLGDGARRGQLGRRHRRCGRARRRAVRAPCAPVDYGAHVTNPLGAVVLAAALVLLTRTRSWLPAVAVGLVAGTNAASDPLLWFAGIAAVRARSSPARADDDAQGRRASAQA